jgi:hypothetical protein
VPQLRGEDLPNTTNPDDWERSNEGLQVVEYGKPIIPQRVPDAVPTAREVIVDVVAIATRCSGLPAAHDVALAEKNRRRAPENSPSAARSQH